MIFFFKILSQHLRWFVSCVVNIILPSRCVLCGVMQQDSDVQTSPREKKISSSQPRHGCATSKFCGTCFGKLFLFTASCCPSCGKPFSLHTNQTMLCLSCAKEKSIFDACRSICAYDQHSSALLTRFKNNRDLTVLPFLSFLLKSVDEGWHSWADWIVPIPLHWTRLCWRGFNQSALLAQAFNARSYHPFLLKRMRRTPSTRGQTRKQRLQNVKGAFGVPKTYQSLVQGKNILLIDDVMTTGATLEEAAHTLLRFKARAVRALSVARVV